LLFPVQYLLLFNICHDKVSYGLNIPITSSKLDDDIYGSFSAVYLHNRKPPEQKVVIATLPVSLKQRRLANFSDRKEKQI
jgi:hypothetical protein